MVLKLGSTDISKVYLGSTLAQKVYLGGTKVWPSIAPPVFDAVGGGSHVNVSGTWTHNATAGSDVFLVIAMDRNQSLNYVRYDGVDMTQIANVTIPGGIGSNGYLRVFRLTNAPGGSKTVSVQLPLFGSAWRAANTFSYLNVGSVGTIQTVSGTGFTASQTVSAPGAGEVRLQTLGLVCTSGGPGNALSLGGGGTLRYNSPSGNWSTIAARESEAAATLTGTKSGASAAAWAGVEIPLIAA